MKRIDWLVWLPVFLIILLMLGVFNQVVFADEIASVTDVVSVTDALKYKQENETLKQQLQLLSNETQVLSTKLAARKCEVAENYLLLLTLQQGLNEAIQAKDWERVQRVLLLIFDVVHRWGKE